MYKKRQKEIVLTLTDHLKSDWLKFSYRTLDKHFTRERILTLDRLIVLVIRGLRMPMQNAINKFFRQLGLIDLLPTASAYSQARDKFKGELFLELNQTILRIFYRKDEDYEKIVSLWKGRRLLGIDCSMINLPDTDELRRKYSLSKNGGEIQRVQAQCSLVYDLLNDITINATLGKQKAEKEYIFDNHDEYISEASDVAVLDMNYADYSVMAYFISKNKYFVIRDRLTHTFRQVWEFAQDPGRKDEIITLEVTGKQRGIVRKKGLPRQIRLRLIKVRLNDGRDEILLTNLFDKAVTTEDFKEVYQKRWNQETYFDRLKNILEVEKFSGFSDQIIKQDFYGTVFLSSLESVMIKDADMELRERSSGLKYEEKVNRSVSLSTMIDYTVDLFLNEKKTIDEKFEELTVFLLKNPVTVRPHRKYDRKVRTSYLRLRYYKYRKKDIS